MLRSCAVATPHPRRFARPRGVHSLAARLPDNRRMSEKTMLLVDGSSYLYRAYHALPDLRSPDDFPTGALHGMVGMMKKLREQFPAEHAACVFDAKGRTFRDDWYADYKANRAPMPEPLVRQIEPIHEAVRLLGWPVLEVPGV
jgi:DNA polymerase-1